MSRGVNIFAGSGMLATATLFCKPCLERGHQCPARESSEEAECIFCEDGVPCPVVQRMRYESKAFTEVN
jgi:hypothetical protein